MKRFIKNIIILSIPFIIYLGLIFVIDPFSYFNHQWIFNHDLKCKVAYKTEPHLYKLISFEKNPKRNVLLGDSRSNGLYSLMDMESWESMAYGGGTVKEIVETFWWMADRFPLDTVLIGISFHIYNKSVRRSWVEEALSMKKSIIGYTFCRYTFEASYMVIKQTLKRQMYYPEDMPWDRQEFWDYLIRTTSSKYMEKYVYPDNYFADLRKISEFCREKGIKLIFWIPPSHMEFQETIPAYGLDKENRTFKKDLNKLGDVFDFDYNSPLTENQSNFEDPLHFTPQIGRELVNEILHTDLKYSHFHKSNS